MQCSKQPKMKWTSTPSTNGLKRIGRNWTRNVSWSVDSNLIFESATESRKREFQKQYSEYLIQQQRSISKNRQKEMGYAHLTSVLKWQAILEFQSGLGWNSAGAGNTTLGTFIWQSVTEPANRTFSGFLSVGEKKTSKKVRKACCQWSSCASFHTVWWENVSECGLVRLEQGCWVLWVEFWLAQLWNALAQSLCHVPSFVSLTWCHCFPVGPLCPQQICLLEKLWKWTDFVPKAVKK